jgi:hypothetical protein
LIFQEWRFNFSSTKGEWDEHHEAASAALLAPSEVPRVDAHVPRGTPRRAVGSPAFLARALLGRRGRPRIGIMPAQNQGVTPQMVSGTFLCGTFL